MERDRLRILMDNRVYKRVRPSLSLNFNNRGCLQDMGQFLAPSHHGAYKASISNMANPI